VWTPGKARSLGDLASLALLTVLVASALWSAGGRARAFSSSPLPTDSPRPPVQTEPTDAAPTTPAEPSSGPKWQRPVGIAAIVLGIVLLLGGLVSLVRR